MAVDFTKDQRKAIDAKGTVLVSAAAGSGKTAVLTERVVKIICDANNCINADRLLIVTFTNASALEMRTRITKRLEEVSLENPLNTYILKQKLLLQNAKICTIDSFCIDIIRRYFAVLGINPDFSVADTVQSNIIKEQCISEILAKRYKEKTEAFDSLCLTFGVEQNERGLVEAIIKIHDFSLCLSQPKKWLRDAVKAYEADDISKTPFAEVFYEYAEQKVSSALNSVYFILREIAGTDLETAYFEGFSQAENALKTIDSYIKSRDWNGLYQLSREFKIRIKTVRKTENADLKDIVKDTRDKVEASVGSIAEKMLSTDDEALENIKAAKGIVSELVSIVEEFTETYFKALCERNVLTFSHIEQLALKLLCNETEDGLVSSQLSKEICKDYDEVLVDEYQDNNNLQDALFYAVSEGGKHLFMVGDVKQSIYGFRNANPDNFLKHKNDFGVYDGINFPAKVILKANFRSRSGVCDFVNAFCNFVMQTSTCGMDYTEEEELVARAEFNPTNTPEVEFLFNELLLSNKKNEEVDAERIAEKIEKIIAKKTELRDKNGVKTATYEDIAILLRSPSKRAKYYIDALKLKGIPVSYDSGDFYESPEIQTVLSLLKVIDNPTRDIPLLSVLLSPIFAFTADDIARLRAKYPHGNLYKLVISEAEIDERFKMVVDIISRFRYDAVTLPIHRLIDEIYKYTGLLELVSAWSGSSDSRDNLMRLVEMAVGFEKHNSGLSQFIDEFERLASSPKSSGKNIKSASNTVKIMSFHGSKGLQFPICFIGGCGLEFNEMDIRSGLIVNDSLGIGLKCVDSKSGVKFTTIAREALALTQKKKLISEEIRLLYVAMTRAEEKLIMSVSLKDIKKKTLSLASSLGVDAILGGKLSADTVNSARGYFSWLIPTVMLQKDGAKLCDYAGFVPYNAVDSSKFLVNMNVEYNIDEGADSDANVSENVNAQNKVILPSADLCNQIVERLEFKYPFASDTLLPSKMAVTKLVHDNNNDDGFDFKARPEFASKSGLTPAEIGTANHKFMQFANYQKASFDIKSEIERLYEWEFLSEDEANCLYTDKLAAFFKSDVFERIRASNNVLREYKFMVEYPYKESTTIVQGIADCIFEEADGMVIVDFKTDRATDVNELAHAYSLQLEVYKYAVERIFGKKVKEGILYSLHLGRSVTV